MIGLHLIIILKLANQFAWLPFTIKGPFKCYVTLFFWKLDPHPPPRNANNIEYYTFVTLFSRKSDTPPHPHLRYVTLEWPPIAFHDFQMFTRITIINRFLEPNNFSVMLQPPPPHMVTHSNKEASSWTPVHSVLV